MNSTIRRGLVVSSLCLGCAALAAGLARGTAPPPSSVAVVDMEKLSANLDQAKALGDRLNAQAAEYQKKLQEVGDARDKVTKDLETYPQDKKGSPEYIQKLAEKYELDAMFKARQEGLTKLIEIAQGDKMKVMFASIVEAVGRMGKERGYDLILWDDRIIQPPSGAATGREVFASIQTRRILFASERVDITNDVMTQMNNEFKLGKKANP